VWTDPGPKFKPVMLTSQKEDQWKKWIGLYNQKMLSKGEFRDLYVYGYDVPEAYAIAKDGKMYYAFFAPSDTKPFQGEVELRGLAPGTYRVFDYANGRDLGTVHAEAGKAPRLKADFQKDLLLEVSAK
jgi:alpha-galactosidase